MFTKCFVLAATTMSYCVTVFTVFQSHLQGLLGTIIDGQSSSRMTSKAD